jgi:hypothetical protein
MLALNTNQSIKPVKQMESLMAGNLSFDHLARLGQKVSWKKFWKFK